MIRWFLRRVLDRLFPVEEINGNGRCPTYLYRRILFHRSWLGIYLHHFVGDDWSLDLHDHPKRFVSIGLKGGYVEVTPGEFSGIGQTFRVFRAPWIRTFPADHIHRLQMLRRQVGRLPFGYPVMEPLPCWTLVLVFKAEREWGFWTEDAIASWGILGAFSGDPRLWRLKWMPWRKYLGSGRATERKSC